MGMNKTGGGGGSGSGGRRLYVDSATEILLREQAAKMDVFRIFAAKVRRHKDLESRRAVLKKKRVEYFRGEDFVSFLGNHPELKDVLESDNSLEIEDIANILLRKKFIVRCARAVKRVRGSKKKLSTWPGHLKIISDQLFSDNDAFFVWVFLDRIPLRQTLLSYFWPVLIALTLASSMYPVLIWPVIFFPLGATLLILLLRAIVFGALWIILGKRVWLFPNMNDGSTLEEFLHFWPNRDRGERPKWTARLFYAVVSLLVILLLRTTLLMKVPEPDM